MDILELLPGDEANLDQFYALARQVYAHDPVWVPQSEAAFQSLLAGPGGQFVQPLLCLLQGVPLARAAAILNPSAHSDQGQLVGYIGFFECLEAYPQAGAAVLEAAERLLRARGAAVVQAPRVDNMLMGLLVDRFDLPQTILTPHNPPYYAVILLDSGYHIRERLYTFLFDRKAVIALPLVLPGFRTRTFNRQNLDAEVQLFHDLQQEIFIHHPGWVPRTLEEDRQMIAGFLPMLDDDLVIIAEDKKGRGVGLIVCLPDVYQAFRGHAVDNARVISVGVIEPLVSKGLGVLMALHLGRNLVAKGYQTLEASWTRDSNLPPQNLATRRFSGQRGREFALFEKTL